MKTLLKNRRSYRSRIGSLDEHDKHDEQNTSTKDNNREESEDGLEDIYVRNDVDEVNRIGGGDEGEGEDGGDINGGEGEVRGGNISGNENEFGDNDNELGGNDDEGGNAEGSRSVEQAGKKRKVNEPATTTRGKRRKMDGSEGCHLLTKKALPKRRVISRKY